MEWRSHSFNEQRQYFEFFNSFIYPYPVPESLLLISVLQKLYYLDATGNQNKSLDYDLIQLCRKWACDIVSGGSFYKNNKNYFTKHEAHFFLNSKIGYNNVKSVLYMFFKAKCKARNIPDSLCRVVMNVFAIKFEQCLDNIIVTSFLDLIARHADYVIDENELGDVCDFILSEIAKYKESSGTSIPFSCSGRTMSSVISLANEWHIQLQREAAVRTDLQHQRHLTEQWKGMPVNNFRFENDEDVWTIKQLCSGKELLNEGRSMKHCVAVYALPCSKGFSAIFHVSGHEKGDKKHKFGNATIEVRPDTRSIVQIKGKCNTAVDPITLRIIKRWAQSNNLKMKSY
jgi:hypothetical protein